MHAGVARRWHRTMIRWQRQRTFVVFIGMWVTGVFVFLVHSFPGTFMRTGVTGRLLDTYNVKVIDDRVDLNVPMEEAAPLPLRRNESRASYRRQVVAAKFIPKTSEEYYQPRQEKVNRLEARFLITNKAFCEDSAPYLLAVVPSIATHTSVRTAIRKTYGSYKAPGNFPSNFCLDCPNNGSRENARVGKTAKVLFFFGRGANTDIDELLREESKRYGDIVQADFQESYPNLTLKMMVILRWVASYCGEVDYVLKIDEDVFVNIPLLISQLHPIPYTVEGLVIGHINYESQVRRLGKWRVRTDQFPLSTYPVYASGNSYVISGNIIPRMFMVSEYMPYMPIEDVFVTGILAKIVGAKHILMAGFTNWLEAVPKPCEFIIQNRITATKVDAALILELWDAQTAYEQRCDTL